MKQILVVFLLINLLLAQDDWQILYQSFHEQEINCTDGWIITNPYSESITFNCAGTNIFGGYDILGQNSIVSKLFHLPPHYKIKIDIQIWRLDSWDGEYMFMMFDEYFWQAFLSHAEGSYLCGWQTEFDDPQNISFEFYHNSPTGSFFLTSSIDQPAYDESWGFRNFTLSILKCDSKCQICGLGYLDNCQMFLRFALNWNNQISAEGWQFNGQGQALASSCGGIQIFGGFQNFGRGAQIQKTFVDLPFHYSLKVKLQFWKIDSWDIINEAFIIEIDEYSVMRYQRNEDGIALCGAYQNQFDWKESIVNYEIDTQHSLPQVKIVLRTTLDESAEIESWGVRDFQLFAATCQKGCKSCTNTECQECLKGYQLQQGLCTQTIRWLTNKKLFFEDQNSQGWQVLNVFQNSNELFTIYQGQYIFGGQLKFGANALVQRDFNLPRHTVIRLQFQFYTFNSQENSLNYFLQVFLDGKIVFQSKTSQNNNDKVQADIFASHSDDTAKIIISSTQQTSAHIQSWGFREFVLLYNLEECVELYTECNYQGNKYELCRTNGEEMDIPKIKSLKVPKGVSVKIKKKIYSMNNQCLN